MKLLKTIKEMICNNKTTDIGLQTMCLTYLALHIQNPGLHPDDAMYDESGYAGWEAVVVNTVLSSDQEIPETFHYPCSMVKLEDTLEAVNTTTNTPIEIVGYINSVLDWLREDMKSSELGSIVDMLQKLDAYYDSEPKEEADEPSVLKECSEVLKWVQEQL